MPGNEKEATGIGPKPLAARIAIFVGWTFLFLSGAGLAVGVAVARVGEVGLLFAWGIPPEIKNLLANPRELFLFLYGFGEGCALFILGLALVRKRAWAPKWVQVFCCVGLLVFVFGLVVGWPKDLSDIIDALVTVMILGLFTRGSVVGYFRSQAARGVSVEPEGDDMSVSKQ